jgi:hypothetical protein
MPFYVCINPKDSVYIKLYSANPEMEIKTLIIIIMNSIDDDPFVTGKSISL